MVSIIQNFSIPIIKARIRTLGPLPILIAGIMVAQVAYGATTIILPYYLYQAYFIGTGTLSMTIIGIIVVVPNVGNFLAASPIGTLSDRYGRKLFLIFGPLIAGLSYVPYIYSDNILILLFTSFMRGVGASMFAVPLAAYVADLAPGRQRGEIMARYSAANLAGSMVGYLVAAPLFILLEAFIFVAFLAILIIPTVFVVFGFVTPSKPSVMIESVGDEIITPNLGYISFLQMIAALKQREFRKFVPIWFISTTLIGTVVNYGPILLDSMAGGGSTSATQEPLLTVGFIFVGVAILTGGTCLLFGGLSDKFGRKPFLFLGVISSAIILTLLAMIMTQQPEVIQQILADPIANLAYPLHLDFRLFFIDVPFYFFVIAAIFLMMPIALFGPTSMAVIADVTKEDTSGASMGLYTALIGAGNMTAAVAGGFVFDNFHVLGVFLFCSILAVINVALMLKFLYETRSIIELDGMDQLLSLWDF